jgi:hypothetical protein
VAPTSRGVCACARERLKREEEGGGSGEALGTNTEAFTCKDNLVETLGISGRDLPALDQVPQQRRLRKTLT